ncbi:MAG: DUF4351 domain-containing protein [Thiocapsa sp. C3-sup]|uniref:DUF4351 domain-containing protein n=1 Tax=unclassified Thiocapsa TaxID=2641286 RepID=UPI0035AEC818
MSIRGQSTYREVPCSSEGKAESLKRLLTRRYGPLAARAEQRIDAAPVAQLDPWLDGIFDTANVEDLIGPDDACAGEQAGVATPRMQ